MAQILTGKEENGSPRLLTTAKTPLSIILNWKNIKFSMATIDCGMNQRIALLSEPQYYIHRCNFLTFVAFVPHWKVLTYERCLDTVPHFAMYFKCESLSSIESC